MGIYFGTDGIRGVFNKDLTIELAFKVGQAIGKINKNSKILIGRDTRRSGAILSLAVASGAMQMGAKIIDVGVCPTAGISFLVTKKKFDLGIVISASHNSAEYNGIKIFNSSGVKIDEDLEKQIERTLFSYKKPSKNIGSYEYNENLVFEYIKFLRNQIEFKLKNKTIVLDLANGASVNVAKEVFKDFDANILYLNDSLNGNKINENCGALHLEMLQTAVVKHKADFGFAFDGDSDRVIAIDENGDIVDGDMIIYLFAQNYLLKNKLKKPIVVGTINTNMAIEQVLNKIGIKLIRTDVGDKFVNDELIKNNLQIGGEQCGHVFVKDKLATGDGILNAILILNICLEENKKLSQYFNFEKCKQTTLNLKVKNKYKILNNENLKILLENFQEKLSDNGRIVVRASGTEPIIRIMIEYQKNINIDNMLISFEKVIKELDGEIKCAE